LDKYCLELFDFNKTNCGLIVVVFLQIKIKNQNNPRLQFLYSHLQLANSVGKKYEENNETSFAKKNAEVDHVSNLKQLEQPKNDLEEVVTFQSEEQNKL
jgi:hypothetical protein